MQVKQPHARLNALFVVGQVKCNFSGARSVKAAEVAQAGSRVQVKQPQCKGQVCVFREWTGLQAQLLLEQVRHNYAGARSGQVCPGCPSRCAVQVEQFQCRPKRVSFVVKASQVRSGWPRHV